MQSLPLDILCDIVGCLHFPDILSCCVVSRRLYRVSTADVHYVRTATEAKESTRRRIGIRCHTEGVHGQALGPLHLSFTLPRMLLWYLRDHICATSWGSLSLPGLKFSSSQSKTPGPLGISTRRDLVRWNKSQTLLIEKKTEAYQAQLGVTRQCRFWGLLAWELFSALPLMLYAGVPIAWLRLGYHVVWGIVALELALLLALFLCVAIRHQTPGLVRTGTPWTQAFALELDIAQTIAAVLTSCLFIHVFEYVVTGRLEELGTVYYVLYVGLVIFFVGAGCSQLTRTFPHLMITAGTVCAGAIIVLPYSILAAEGSFVARLVNMLAFTPFNAFCICVTVSSFGLKGGAIWGLLLVEATKEFVYVAGLPSVSLMLQCVATLMVFARAQNH